MFVDNSATITNPATIAYKVSSVEQDEAGNRAIALEAVDADTLANTNIQFVQTLALTQDMIAVQPYGAIFVPASVASANKTITATLGSDTYTATVNPKTVAVGATVTLTKSE